MLRLSRLFVLSLGFGSVGFPAALARENNKCLVSPTSRLALFSSPETRSVGWVGKTNEVTVSACGSQVAGAYILATLGPDVIDAGYRRSNAYQGDFLDDRCQIQGARVAPVLPHAQRLAYYKVQSRYVQSCVDVLVEDDAGLPVQVPAHMDNCQIQRLGSSRVLARGGACYFRVQRGTSLRFTYAMRPECGRADFLRAQGIPALDTSNIAGFYVAGDATGSSLALDPLDFMDLRVSTRPPESLLPLSVDMGPTQPRWPIRMNFDAHLGPLRVHVSEGEAQLEPSLIVDNRCARTCDARSGLCSSPCDHMIPVGAEMLLYRTTGGRNELIDSWYMGGAVAPQWVGAIPAPPRPFTYPFFKKGESFALIARMNWPDTYYRLSKDNFQQFVIRLPRFRPDLVGSVPLPKLDPLVALQKQFPVVPGFVPVQGIREARDAFTSRFQEGLLTLAGYLSFESWPPNYRDVCARDGAACGVPYQNGYQSILRSDFTVKEAPAEGEVVFERIVHSRQSNILGNYAVSASEFPKIVCGEEKK